MWTARCKSDYQFGRHTCRKTCRRGMLMCDDCLSAEVIPAPVVRSWWRESAALFVSALTMLVKG